MELVAKMPVSSAPKRSACAMDAKGVERVVIAEAAFDFEDHERAEETGEETDEQSREGLNESRGGGDGDESGDCAGDGAEGGGFAVVDPLGDGPAEGGSSGGEVSVDEGTGCQRSGRQGAAGIESEPAYP